MKKTNAGFSVIEALLFVVVIVLLVGASLAVYHRRQPKAITTSQTTVKTQTVTANGTTQSIDQMTAQDSSSEAAIDSKHSGSETSTAQSANSAASNIGGAYNESSL